jgi:hypothetical protein
MANGDSGDTKMAAGVKSWLCGGYRFCCRLIGIIRRRLLAAAIFASTLFAAISAGLWIFGKFEPIGLQEFIVAATAIFGLPLLVWRTTIHDKQADAAQKQVVIADRLRLEGAYDRAARRFENNTLATRLSGLHGLWELAREYPQIYHVQIMELLCALIRKPPPLDDWNEDEDAFLANRPDVAAGISLIRDRSDEQINVEQERKYRLDFTSANLEDADFQGANLQHACFNKANLSKANFAYADLRAATLIDVALMTVIFDGADLRKANIIADAEAGGGFAFMKDAAVNGMRFYFAVSPDLDEITKSVVLIDGSGKDLPPGAPDFLHPLTTTPKLRRMSLEEWEEKRGKRWRRNLPPFTRR